MNELSKAVITSVSHGYTEDMLKAGLKTEWIPDNDGRVIFDAAIDLYRQKQKINRLALLVKCAGRLTNAEDVKNLLSLNGQGDVPHKEVVKKCRDHNLKLHANALKEKFGQLMARDANGIADWLPILSARLNELAVLHRAYDPRPSSHTGPIVSPIMFRSSIQTYNRMWAGRASDGGGYRCGWWRVWVGVSGKGKTTTGYTIGTDAVIQGRRVTYISKENQKQVSARLLLALSRLTLEEINTRKAKQQEVVLDENGQPYIVRDTDGNILGEWHNETTRRVILDRWIENLDRYVRIYDWKNFSIAHVRNIVSWDDPHVVIIDYIGPEDVDSKQDIKYGLGKLSAGCEELAHETGKAVEGMFQMSNAEAIAYQKNSTHIVAGPYGSGAVIHPADEVIQTKKDNYPDRQHYLMTKSRAGGPVEEFVVGFDTRRWAYEDLPEPSP